MRKSLRRGLLIAIALSAAVAWAVLGWGRAVRPRVEPTKVEAPPPAEPQPPADDDPVIASVGPRELRRGDLARFAAVRALFVSGRIEQQSVADLAERTLLVLAAEKQGVALDPDQREAALRRRRLLGAALASSATPRPASIPDARRVRAREAPAPPIGPPLPDPLALFLSQRSLTEEDLRAEVEADLLAEAVKDRMVYARIEIPDDELEREAATQIGRGDDDAIRASIRRRLAQARGREELTAYLDSLRAQWPVKLDVR